MQLMDEILAGAVGGVAGGAVMTGVMMMGKRTGMIEEPLPVKVERRAKRAVGVMEQPGPRQEMVIGMAGHMLYSAAVGGGYGLLHAARQPPAIPSGPLYGLALYAVNLLGAGPALDITRGPWNEEPVTAGRRAMMHLVYGTVTALVAERVRERLS
jgi:hypothetical protein